MQLDRRVLVAAGLGISTIGISGLGSSNSASATGAERPRPTNRNIPPAAASPTAHASPLFPDSGRDETAALQAAIDRAAGRRQPLTLPAGRFIVRGLQLRAGSHLIGSGGSTVLVHAGGAPVLSASAVADISIERISVEGSVPLADPAGGLIELRGVPRVHLRDLAVSNSPANGIVLERCGGLVTHCTITGAARAGLFSLDAEGGLEISHNRLAGHGNNGILVWRSAIGEDGTIVSTNRIERIAARNGGTGENGNGINVFRAGGVIVTSNRISDCAYSAVRANSASNVQIVSNNIARMGEVAIYAEFAFEGAVISGNIVDRASTGVSVTNFDNGGRLAVVQGNLIRNLFVRPGDPAAAGGFGISVEADAAITGNTVENAPTAGLLIGWGRFCRDVAATGNVVRKSSVGVAITSDSTAGAVLVANNMISGATRGAIRAMDHGRLVGDDLALAQPANGRIRAHGNVVG